VSSHGADRPRLVVSCPPTHCVSSVRTTRWPRRAAASAAAHAPCPSGDRDVCSNNVHRSAPGCASNGGTAAACVEKPSQDGARAPGSPQPAPLWAVRRRDRLPGRYQQVPGPTSRQAALFQSRLVVATSELHSFVLQCDSTWVPHEHGCHERGLVVRAAVGGRGSRINQSRAVHGTGHSARVSADTSLVSSRDPPVEVAAPSRDAS
jgi:hypothetical protein